MYLLCTLLVLALAIDPQQFTSPPASSFSIRDFSHSTSPPWDNWMRGPPCPDRFTPVDDFSIVQQDQDVQNALKQVQVAVVEYIKLVGLKLGLQVCLLYSLMIHTQVGISLQVVYDQHVLANINEGLIDVKLPNSKPTPDTGLLSH